MTNKFDKAFIRGAINYNAPLTDDLKCIVEGLRDLGRRAIAEPYMKLKQDAERFANVSRQAPDQAWLELMFGRKEKQSLIDKIKKAQNDGSNKLNHNGKEWDLRKKEIRDLLNSMLKNNQPQAAEPPVQSTPKPDEPTYTNIPVKKAPQVQVKRPVQPQIKRPS